MNIHYPHNFRSEMYPFIPVAAERVLDVGCNTGAFGEGLKTRREVVVWGVEPNGAAAAKASFVLDHVINDTFSVSTAVPDRFFDVIVFNDVLDTWWTRGKCCELLVRSSGPEAVLWHRSQTCCIKRICCIFCVIATSGMRTAVFVTGLTFDSLLARACIGFLKAAASSFKWSQVSMRTGGHHHCCSGWHIAFSVANWRIPSTFSLRYWQCQVNFQSLPQQTSCQSKA